MNENNNDTYSSPGSVPVRPTGVVTITVMSNRPSPFKDLFAELTAMNMLDIGDGGETQHIIGAYRFDTALRAASFLAQSAVFDGETTTDENILKEPAYLRAPSDGEERVALVSVQVLPGIAGAATVEEHIVYTASSDAFRAARRGIGRLSAILRDLLPINDRLHANWNDVSMKFTANAVAQAGNNILGVRNTLLDQSNAAASSTATALGKLAAALTNPIMPAATSAATAAAAAADTPAAESQSAFDFSRAEATYAASPAPAPAAMDSVAALVEDTRSAPEAIEAVIEALPKHLQPEAVSEAISKAVAVPEEVLTGAPAAPMIPITVTITNAGAVVTPVKPEPAPAPAAVDSPAEDGNQGGASVGFCRQIDGVEPSVELSVPQVRINLLQSWNVDDAYSVEVNHMSTPDDVWGFVNISLSIEAARVLREALRAYQLLCVRQATLFERGDFVQTKKRIGASIVSDHHLAELRELSAQWDRFVLGSIANVDWHKAAV